MDLQQVIIITITRHIPCHTLSRKLFRLSPKMTRLANSFRRHSFLRLTDAVMVQAH